MLTAAILLLYAAVSTGLITDEAECSQVSTGKITEEAECAQALNDAEGGDDDASLLQTKVFLESLVREDAHRQDIPLVPLQANQQLAEAVKNMVRMSKRGQLLCVVLCCLAFLRLSLKEWNKVRPTPIDRPLQADRCVDHFVTHKAASVPPQQQAAGSEDSSSIHEPAPPCSHEWRIEPLDCRFVLPLCETWYAISVEKAAMLDGAFDILRNAGYPALCGVIMPDGPTRRLEIYCSSLQARLSCVSIDSPVHDSDTGIDNLDHAFPLMKVGDASGDHCGQIRPSSHGTFMVSVGNRDVLSMTPDGRQLVLRSVEADQDKVDRVLANASWFQDSELLSGRLTGPGHLAIRVNPAVDTILVLSCALALTTLSSDKHLLHFTRPADCGAS